MTDLIDDPCVLPPGALLVDVAAVLSSIVLPVVDQFPLDGGNRDVAFVALDSLERRCAALKAAVVMAVDAVGAFTDDGHRTVRTWLRAVTNGGDFSTGRTVHTARMLAALPAVAAAAAAGQLGPDQLADFTHLYKNPRVRPHLAVWEQFLLDGALDFVHHDFQELCRRFQDGADPDGAHADHDTSRTNRTAHNVRIGAGFRLLMEGDALTGDIIANILDAHIEAEFQTDLANRAAQWGDDATNHPLARTPGQRRFDAIETIFLKAASLTDTTNREPLVIIHTTPEDLQDALTTLVNDRAGDDEDSGDDEDDEDDEDDDDLDCDCDDCADARNTADDATTHDTDTGTDATDDTGTGDTGTGDTGIDDTDATHDATHDATGETAAAPASPTPPHPRPRSHPTTAKRQTATPPGPRLRLSETASGAPVGRRDLALAAIHGRIQRITTDRNGVTINLGRTTRLFTGSARNAILLATNRCTTPGCHNNYRNRHIDHLRPWEHGGRTDQHNGGPVCPTCHRNRHHANITVTHNHTGWHYHRPDGTEITPRHRPPPTPTRPDPPTDTDNNAP